MKRLLLLLACVAFATGCSSVRSFLPGSSDGGLGDQMLSQAQETESLGKSWKEGQRLVEKGNKLLAKSEDLARESRDTQAEAEGLIAQGKTLIAGSERDYEMAMGTEQNQLFTR